MQPIVVAPMHANSSVNWAEHSGRQVTADEADTDLAGHSAALSSAMPPQNAGPKPESEGGDAAGVAVAIVIRREDTPAVGNEKVVAVVSHDNPAAENSVALVLAFAKVTV